MSRTRPTREGPTCSAVQYNTVQYSTVQYSIVQGGSDQRGEAHGQVDTAEEAAEVGVQLPGQHDHAGHLEV